MCADFSLGRPFFGPPPDTLRPEWEQPFAVMVEIHQREGGQQPLVVFLQAAIARFGKSKHPLQDAEGPLHLRPHPGLGAVLSSLLFIPAAPVSGSPRGHVLRMRSRLANRTALSLIPAVAPHLPLLTMQQVGQHVLVGH